MRFAVLALLTCAQEAAESVMLELAAAGHVRDRLDEHDAGDGSA